MSSHWQAVARRVTNSGLRTQHSALTQYSALSTQHSVLSTQHSVLSTQYSALSTQHSALSTQYSSLQISPLDRIDLGHSAPMPFFGEIACKPHFNNFLNAGGRDHLAPQSQHIRAVVLAAVLR